MKRFISDRSFTFTICSHLVHSINIMRTKLIYKQANVYKKHLVSVPSGPLLRSVCLSRTLGRTGGGIGMDSAGPGYPSDYPNPEKTL